MTLLFIILSLSLSLSHEGIHFIAYLQKDEVVGSKSIGWVC